MTSTIHNYAFFFLKVAHEKLFIVIYYIAKTVSSGEEIIIDVKQESLDMKLKR